MTLTHETNKLAFRAHFEYDKVVTVFLPFVRTLSLKDEAYYAQ